MLESIRITHHIVVRGTISTIINWIVLQQVRCYPKSAARCKKQNKMRSL